MNIEQLEEKIQNLNITPPDKLRAVYYIEVLEDIQTQLQMIPDNTDIQDNLQIEKALVQEAFKKKKLTDLLNTYARILDNVIHGGLNTEIKNFTGLIDGVMILQLTADQVIRNLLEGDGNYVQKFYSRYPFLNRITNNIKDNLIASLTKLARRVSNDIADLNNVFRLGITSLIRIESIDNYLVKGGQQNLFLTFQILTGIRAKLIYKPSDV
ncbi:MAG TPA: hypothetical protein DCS93_31645 [Microscillaceae bacterium]|nr:hypothetical protein [Microscillaceae bacterium]